MIAYYAYDCGTGIARLPAYSRNDGGGRGDGKDDVSRPPAGYMEIADWHVDTKRVQQWVDEPK